MKLDGKGLPFITLAQFLKLNGEAHHGGAAKALVREGGVKVNGTFEDRPGRKLHPGDKVSVGTKELEVKAEHVEG